MNEQPKMFICHDMRGNIRVSSECLIFQNDIGTIPQRINIDFLMCALKTSPKQQLHKSRCKAGAGVYSFLFNTDRLGSHAGIIAIYPRITTDDLGEITDFNKLYDFISSFDHANEELMATSPIYWCEERYHDYWWNKDLLVPQRNCDSKRLAALGHEVYPRGASDASGSSAGASSASSSAASSAASLLSGAASSASGSSAGASASSSSSSVVAGASASSSSSSVVAAVSASSSSSSAVAGASASSSSSSSASGSSGRRTRRLSGGGGSSSYVPGECKDDDHELQIEEGDPTLTCAGWKDHVGAIDSFGSKC